MKKLILILCLLTTVLGWGQDSMQDLERVLQQTNDLIDNENYDGAIDVLKNALVQFKEKEDWSSYVKVVIELAFLFDELDVSVQFMNAQIEMISNKIGNADNRLAELYHQYGTVLYYNFQKRDRAIEKYEKALEIRNRALEFPHIDLARTNYMVGYCSSYLGYLEKGINRLKEARKNYEKVDRPDKVNKCNRELAACYTDLGEFQIAEGLYKTVIDYSNKIFGSNSTEIAFAFNLLGIMYDIQKKYHLSKEYYHKAESIYAQNIDYEDDQADCLNNLANIYKEEKNLTNAIEYYKRAATIKNKTVGEDHPEIAKIYENIGLTYKSTKDYLNSYFWLKKALDIRIQSVEGQKSLDLNKSYHNLGDLFLEQSKYEKALGYFQKAIQQEVLNFNEPDYFTNPSIDESLLLLGAKNELLIDLKFKGLALKEGYQQNGKIEYLKAANSTFVLATNLIDEMRADFLGSGTKTFWLNETFPVFENAIETSRLLYQLQPSESLFAEIIDFMEQNKAVLLLENLNINKGILDIGMSDSLINKHKIFLQLEENVQSELIENLEKNNNDSLIRETKNQLIQIKKDRAVFEEYLRDNYPKFKRLAKSSSSEKDSNFKAFLLPNQIFLEYFVGDSTTYIAGITKDHFSLKAISTRELRQHTSDLLYVIHPSRRHKANSEEYFKKFTQASYSLYGLLLKELLEEFPNSIEQLIIVPDDVISYLPFDILLQEAVDSGKVNYSSDHLNYLIKNYSTTYTYSGTVLTDIISSQKTFNKTVSFLGFAPGFKGDNNNISGGRACNFETPEPLKYNQPEVENINIMMKGKAMIGNTASKANFIDMASKYSILHLATHACADAENSARNRIFFSDGHLYNHELSNLDIAADMVVLSACETGIGEFKRGEGVMSLARGFAYSGTPSITMSLWSVNDQSTSEIMSNYYQHLNEGASKDIALRNAKLDYLSNQEDYYKIHPLFWAAFVHYGNTEPIVEQSYWKWYLGGVIFLLLIYGFVRYFRR